MKCFYHKSDLDGHCSGAIIKLKHPECEMIGVDYNDSLSDFKEIMEPGEDVYVVDFSFSQEEMEELYWNYILIWIDHHKTAIEKMKRFPEIIIGKRDIGFSGCELTWEFCFPTMKTPYAVMLLGRYDVWDHTNEDVLHFQFGIRIEENTLPESDIWQYLLRTTGQVKDFVDGYIHNGKIILAYQFSQNDIYARGMSFEVEFEGYRAIVINKAFSNSKIFESVYDPERHDIMILFAVKPGEIKYSLYSAKDDVDVSKIAQKYGGGGHAKAAGFYSKELII